MAERVTRLETQVACLPELQDDVRALRERRRHDDGRDETLTLILRIALGSGILSLVGDILILAATSGHLHL